MEFILVDDHSCDSPSIADLSIAPLSIRPISQQANTKMPLPRGRRAYDRVNANDAEEPDVEVAAAEEEQQLEKQDPSPTLDQPIVEVEDNGERIIVVVMDPAQSKFEISANPNWTIQKFKDLSMTVHKVPPASQRLIYRGKMLADQTTLRDAGITKDRIIIHLFPKPRVVVSSEERSSGQPDDEGGAHVPQIVLDPREAEMRSSILVLGSAEIMEAQNNVKLLSFLLLIICSMELLALFTIMLGVPDDTSAAQLTDDTALPNTGDDTIAGGGTPRTWRNSDYFDLALSTFGVYVATLGIKATTENTIRLSRRYLICTVIIGCFWNAFYFYLYVQADEDADAKRVAKHSDSIPPMTQKDFYVQAFFAILIPAMVWFLCCIRAFLFYFA
jgi:Ubiquitin family